MGFSALVSGERGEEYIDEYLKALREILENKRSIEYLVFSDSIVITTTNDLRKRLKQF